MEKSGKVRMRTRWEAGDGLEYEVFSKVAQRIRPKEQEQGAEGTG